MKTQIFALLIAAAASSPSLAACTEERYVPEVMECASNTGGKFADFSKGGCTYNPAKTITVEVECPGRWVNVIGNMHRYEIKVKTGSYEFYGDTFPIYSPNPKHTHESLCAAHGLRPVLINGLACASGRARPTSGAGYQEISYKYGTGSTQRSGTSVQTTAMKTCNYHHDSCTVEENTNYYYAQCGIGNSISQKDAVVAVACQP